MKAQIMQRECLGGLVGQNSSNSYVSATDLVKVTNLWRSNNNKSAFVLHDWLRRESIKDFLTALEAEEQQPVMISTRGRNGQVWLHPRAILILGLELHTDLKLQLTGWFFDHLLVARNNSGESFKNMAEAFKQYVEKTTCPYDQKAFGQMMAKCATKIRQACGVKKDWNHACQAQLIKRNKIQELIANLCDILNDIDLAIEKGIGSYVKLPNFNNNALEQMTKLLGN